MSEKVTFQKTVAQMLSHASPIFSFGSQVLDEFMDLKGVRFVFGGDEKDELPPKINIDFDSSFVVLSTSPDFISNTYRLFNLDLLLDKDQKNAVLKWYDQDELFYHNIFCINWHKRSWNCSLQRFPNGIIRATLTKEATIKQWSWDNVRQLHEIFDNTEQIFFTVDKYMRIQSFNTSAHAYITRLINSELKIGVVLSDLLSFDDKQSLGSQFASSIRTRRTRFVHRFESDSKDSVWLAIEIVSLIDNNNEFAGIAFLAQDITASKNIEEQMKNLEQYDPVLQIPNRKHLTSMLSETISSYALYSIVAIDIDNFKLINDSLGHDSGDQLLKQAAERISSYLSEDEIITRSSGDQFIIIMHGKGVKRAVELIKQVVHSQEEAFEVDQKDVYITYGFGVVPSSSSYKDHSEIMRDVDNALTQAKRRGRGQYVVFTPSQQVNNVQILELQNELRRTVANHGLDIFYQPIVDSQSFRIKYFECLVRWNRKGEFLSPGLFLKIADDAGFLHEIDNWMMIEACKQINSWQKMGVPFGLSVNISFAQIMQPEFKEFVLNLLETYHIQKNRLMIELSENLVIEKKEDITEMLSEFQKHGLRIALDDFGTGYSSLALLKHFPLDIIKIDQSFVRDLNTSHDSQAIVKATITLAHEMQLEVVSEGVETTQQIDFLQKSGSNSMQGYYFYPPLQISYVRDLVAEELTLNS